jgi:hypothetical protein
MLEKHFALTLCLHKLLVISPQSLVPIIQRSMSRHIVADKLQKPQQLAALGSLYAYLVWKTVLNQLSRIWPTFANKKVPAPTVPSAVIKCQFYY